MALSELELAELTRALSAQRWDQVLQICLQAGFHRVLELKTRRNRNARRRLLSQPCFHKNRMQVLDSVSKSIKSVAQNDGANDLSGMAVK